MYYLCLKHHKNCKCCPLSLLILRSQRLSWIQVLNCQNCNQCLKGHKSQGSLSLSKLSKIVGSFLTVLTLLKKCQNCKKKVETLSTNKEPLFQVWGTYVSTFSFFVRGKWSSSSSYMQSYLRHFPNPKNNQYLFLKKRRTYLTKYNIICECVISSKKNGWHIRWINMRIVRRGRWEGSTYSQSSPVLFQWQSPWHCDGA